MTRILLTGKTGQLGSEMLHALAPLGEVIAPGRNQLDLTDPASICKTIRECAPDIIVNTAGYTTVDQAEKERELAHQINALAPGVIAEEAKKIGALMMHYSTDYVYDGSKGAFYDEEDTPNPLNYYGKSKLDGERAVIATGCAHLILRASWIYSAHRTNFVLTMLRLARERKELSVVDDQVGSPTWAKSLAQSSEEILTRIQEPRSLSGIYHLSAAGRTTRFDFAKLIIEVARQVFPADTPWAEIHPTTTAKYPLPAERPLNVATCKAKIKRDFGVTLTSWQEQIERFIRTLPVTP